VFLLLENVRFCVTYTVTNSKTGVALLVSHGSGSSMMSKLCRVQMKSQLAIPIVLCRVWSLVFLPGDFTTSSSATSNLSWLYSYLIQQKAARARDSNECRERGKVELA
jgi:hypothetical protein